MSSKYQLWIRANGGKETIRFPVLPETFNIKNGVMNKNVNIQGLGEVIIKGDPSAVVFSFSSFFPVTAFPGVQFRKLKPPSDLKDRIINWQKREQPVQLIVTGTNINLYCVVDDFTCFEQGGDVGTLHYTLSLKEYKEVAARQVKIDIPAGTASVPEPAPVRTDNRAPERTYTVVKGDNLWNIAAKHLGCGSRYIEIFELNRDQIKNPNLIYVGQVFKLPA